MQKLLTKYRMIVQAILAIAYITIICIYQQPYKCRWLSNNRAHCSYNKKWGGLTMQNHAACTVHFQTPTCHNKKKLLQLKASEWFTLLLSLTWDGMDVILASGKRGWGLGPLEDLEVQNIQASWLKTHRIHNWWATIFETYSTCKSAIICGPHGSHWGWFEGPITVETMGVDWLTSQWGPISLTFNIHQPTFRPKMIGEYIIHDACWIGLCKEERGKESCLSATFTGFTNMSPSSLPPLLGNRVTIENNDPRDRSIYIYIYCTINLLMNEGRHFQSDILMIKQRMCIWSLV